MKSDDKINDTKNLRLKFYRKYLNMEQECFANFLDIPQNTYKAAEINCKIISSKLEERLFAFERKGFHKINKEWFKTSEGNITECDDDRTLDFSKAYRIGCIIDSKEETIQEVAYYLHLREDVLRYLLKQTKKKVLNYEGEMQGISWVNEYLVTAIKKYFNLNSEWFKTGIGSPYQKQGISKKHC